MAVVIGELVVGVGSIPKTHLDQTDQDRITDITSVPSTKLLRPSDYIHQQSVVVIEVIHRILLPMFIVERPFTRNLTVVL